jgi:peptide/nickel transport system substrate-binding protein
MTSAAVLAQACQPQPTEAPTEAAEPTATPKPAEPTATPKPAEPTPTPEPKGGQAPAWEEMVKAGTLPPLEERLPPEPQVIEPYEEIGTYGGTVRVAIGNANSLFGDPQGAMGTEGILRIGRDFNSAVGGLAESWEFNDDATEQTLFFRKGLMWSDGAPFTTEDCLFDYYDRQRNEVMSPAGPSGNWTTGLDKTPMEMEALDDFTLKLTFAEPFPLIVANQAHYAGTQRGGMFAPKHYAKQFHADYADAAELDKMVKDGEFETWRDLFNDKTATGSTLPRQIDLPGMTAFIRTADDPDHHTHERSPYYWKVDPAGNQLPYWDKCIIYVIADKELLTARLIAGELDMVGHSSYLKNMELYAQNRESANLKIYMWDSTLVTAVLIYANLTHKDPELREFFQNKNARIALSIALDREEINDLVHFGLGFPRQIARWPRSPFFKEGDDKVHAEYDPDKANQLLDEEGYTDKDGDGYRLLPSGKRLGWTAQFDPEQGDIAPTMELALEYWKDIGIDMKIKPINRDLYSQLAATNDLDMKTWQADEGCDLTWPTLSKELRLMPGSGQGWAWAWSAWYWFRGQYPDIEEEPPEWVKELMAHWEDFLAAIDEDVKVTAVRKAFDIFYDQLPCFGTCGVPQAIVLNKDIANFPEHGVWGFGNIRAVPANPEQFFYKRS